jgi:hypothetical protein
MAFSGLGVLDILVWNRWTLANAVKRVYLLVLNKIRRSSFDPLCFSETRIMMLLVVM